jgi:hypothetical protein
MPFVLQSRCRAWLVHQIRLPSFRPHGGVGRRAIPSR